SRALDHKAAEQAASHGVHTFLNGPLSAGQLHDAIYQALGRREATEAATAPAAPEQVAAAEPPPTPAPAPEPPRSSRAATPAPPPEPERPRRDRAEAPRAQATAESRRTEGTSPPAEPPARKPAPRPRGGSLVLTEENIKPIRGRMEALSQDIGSQCILLANRAGMVLTEVGITSGLPTMILLPLLSTSFSTAGQISQMLREEDSTALYMHEGNR